MNKSAKILVGIVALAVIAVGIFMLTKGKDSPSSATSSANTTTDASPKRTSSNTSVSIKDFAFEASSTTVKVGTTVTWTNDDSAAHTVTADTASADAPDSKQLASGETYSFTFNKAGTYKYHCSNHSSMQGTVVVTE